MGEGGRVHGLPKHAARQRGVGRMGREEPEAREGERGGRLVELKQKKAALPHKTPSYVAARRTRAMTFKEPKELQGRRELQERVQDCESGESMNAGDAALCCEPHIGCERCEPQYARHEARSARCWEPQHSGGCWRKDRYKIKARVPSPHNQIGACTHTVLGWQAAVRGNKRRAQAWGALLRMTGADARALILQTRRNFVGPQVTDRSCFELGVGWAARGMVQGWRGLVWRTNGDWVRKGGAEQGTTAVSAWSSPCARA